MSQNNTFYCYNCNKQILYSYQSTNPNYCTSCLEEIEGNKNSNKSELNSELIIEQNLKDLNREKLLPLKRRRRIDMSFVEFESTILNIDNILSVNKKKDNFKMDTEEYYIEILTRTGEEYKIGNGNSEDIDLKIHEIRDILSKEQKIYPLEK